MLGAHLAVGVYETCAFSAAEDFALLFREEFVAVSALIQVILVFFEE